MREIKFRGKTKDGEWVFGYLADKNVINVLVQDDSTGVEWIDDVEVIPETIGQFTGLHDKNGNEIYEGGKGRQWLEDSVEPEGGYWWEFEVRQHPSGMWVACQVGFDYSNTELREFTPLYEIANEMEIIGNIHENQMR